MALEDRRGRVAAARQVGGPALASALVELAEVEPIFAHRGPTVRALLEEAARLLDAAPDGALEGRVLLRLAALHLVDDDHEGAEQLVDRAFDRLHAASDDARLLEAGGLLARVQIHRGRLETAEPLLVSLAERLPSQPGSPEARRAACSVGLAWAELALEQGDAAAAGERFAEIARAAASDGELPEVELACRQGEAYSALARGDVDRACHALRAAVGLARAVGAFADEGDLRVALAGALVERGDLAGRDEAERHLQITRDLALEHGLDAQHMEALVGQAGLLARKGQTQGALDRCIEIARSAVERKDVARYVAAVGLMSQIYEQQGDAASAYRALAEANLALKDKFGPDAQALIVPLVRGLAERMGRNSFEVVADNVAKALSARDQFRREP